MPGLSSREPVKGAFGVGRVHIRFKPKKPRSFPWGLLLYISAIIFAFMTWSWSQPKLKTQYMIPTFRYILHCADGFRRGSSPPKRVELNGIGLEVNILERNSNGRLLISGNSLQDVIFSQGYLHASERLFQMEALRRAALGQLSEIFGNEYVLLDRTTRTLNIPELGRSDLKTLTSNETVILRSYCAGVNAYLALKRALPIEFLILRMKNSISVVLNWEPEHVLSILRLIAVAASHGGEEEITRKYLEFIIGNEAAASILHEYKHTDQQHDFHSYTHMFAPSIGSSAWVVSSPSVGTGRTILSADLQTEASLVSSFMDLSFECPELRSAGASLPGIPLVIQGRNRHLAWGLTLAPVDMEDTFLEQISMEVPPGEGSEHQNRFRYLLHGVREHPGEVLDSPLEEDTSLDVMGRVWKMGSIRREVILVKDDEPVVEDVIETVRGPVISNLLHRQGASVATGLFHHENSRGLAGSAMLALCSQALRGEGGGIRFLWLMNKASTEKEVQEASTALHGMALNVVYSGAEGNAGYFVTGRVPLRSGGHVGDIPVSSTIWPASHVAPYYSSWTGEEDADKLLRSALTSRQSTDEHPELLPVLSCPINTASQLKKLLVEKPIGIAHAMLALCDDHSPQSLSLANLINAIPTNDASLSNRTVNAAKALLKGFNGSYSVSASVPLLLETFRIQLTSRMKRIAGWFSMDLGTTYLPYRRSAVFGSSEFYSDWNWILPLLEGTRNASWFTRAEESESKSHAVFVSDLLRSAVEDSMRWLEEEFGKSDRWRWGDVHSIVYSHPFEGRGFLSDLLVAGGEPLGGNDDSVLRNSLKNIAYLGGKHTFKNSHGPTSRYRMIVTLPSDGGMLSVVDSNPANIFGSSAQEASQKAWKHFCDVSGQAWDVRYSSTEEVLYVTLVPHMNQDVRGEL